MVAKTTHHLFQPLLYQVATGILSEGEIAPPTREVLARQKNATVLLGEVTDIDLEAQTVTSHVLGRETVTPYDSLIVAAGSSQSYFGNDQFAEFAPGHEEHRRRARAARPDLRRLRARRARRDARRERRPPAHLRRRRRRPDRRRDGRPDRRAVPPHAAAATSGPSTPATPGSSSSTRPARCCRRSAPSSARRPSASSRSSASRCCSARWSPTSTSAASRSTYKDGRVERIESVTKIWAAGRPGQLADHDPLRADRRPARPGRPDRRQPRPHAARPPRGVRGRRHDRPRPPPRRRAGRDPGREVRRRGDRPSAGGQAAAEAVQVLRQGLDGHHQPVPRGGADRQAPAHRLHRLADVAGRAPLLRHRLQEPGHRGAALGGLVPRPRPLGAHRDRAADLRPAWR